MVLPGDAFISLPASATGAWFSLFLKILPNCSDPCEREKSLKTNVRIIAATNKDLEKEINAGTFREDLYHRLAVIKIHLPSLNDRKADIPELTKHFIFEISKDQGVKPKDITLKAQRMLQEHTWKGNVRELRNTIERLLILGDNPINIKNIESFI